jgi:hypothetical protein
LGENDEDSNAEFPSSHSTGGMDEVSKADVKPFSQDKKKPCDTDHALEVNIINNTDHAVEVTDEVNQLELLKTMKSKANELTKMIMMPLTQKEQKQFDDIINDTDHKAIDTFKSIGKEKVSWKATKKLLNKKEGPEIENKHKWVNDEVVNYYCHNFLGKEDINRCEHNWKKA